MYKHSSLAFALAATLLTACSTTQSPQPQQSQTAPELQQLNGDDFLTYIVGGTESKPHSRPYVVMVKRLADKGFYMCGGSIINKEWILTAAHCVDKAKLSDLRVRVGVHDRKVKPKQGEEHKVVKSIVHPKWGKPSKGHDIAVLKLSTPIKDPNAAAISLPSNRIENILDQHKARAIVSGWGKQSGRGKSSAVLREVDIPISPTDKCGVLGRPADISICGLPEEGKDSCNGDSGGPLAQAYQGKMYVLGIVSYGLPSCKGNGVYTKVHSFNRWIKQHTGIDPESGDPIGKEPDPNKPKTYTGTVNANSSSFQPNGSKGFDWKGGTINATLSSTARGDFDLYLQKKEGVRWVDVDSSTNNSHNETITYNAAAGTYRWEIYAYDGQGKYSLTVK